MDCFDGDDVMGSHVCRSVCHGGGGGGRGGRGEC